MKINSIKSEHMLGFLATLALMLLALTGPVLLGLINGTSTYLLTRLFIAGTPPWVWYLCMAVVTVYEIIIGSASDLSEREKKMLEIDDNFEKFNAITQIIRNRLLKPGIILGLLMMFCVIEIMGKAK